MTIKELRLPRRFTSLPASMWHRLVPAGWLRRPQRTPSRATRARELQERLDYAAAARTAAERARLWL